MHFLHCFGTSLNNFGSQRQNLHIILISELSCYRAKDTCTSHFLSSLTITAAFSSNLIYEPSARLDSLTVLYYNGFNYITFFYNSARCCLFNRTDDLCHQLPHIFSCEPPITSNTHYFFCACIISDF